MNLREAAQQALEVLEDSHQNINPERRYADELTRQIADAITALRAALAEATSQESRQVEPVAWITPGQDLHLVNYEGFQDWVPLYTAPPKCEPLTAPQIHELDWPDDVAFEDILEFARAIERAHDIGGEE